MGGNGEAAGVAESVVGASSKSVARFVSDIYPSPLTVLPEYTEAIQVAEQDYEQVDEKLGRAALTQAFVHGTTEHPLDRLAGNMPAALLLRDRPYRSLGIGERLAVRFHGE